MIHYAAVHARFSRHEAGTFWLSRLRKGPGMRFGDSIFGRLLKPVSRVQLAATVSRHGGNAYDKTFKSWDHMVALVFAQLAGIDSLRSSRRSGMPIPIITTIWAPVRWRARHC